MENKYYTPTIDELHPGFECEVKLVILDIANMIEENIDEFLLNYKNGVTKSKLREN